MKLRIVVVFTIVLGLIFLSSCRDEEIVTTSWDNIVICNSVEFEIPDLFQGDIKFVTPSGGVYTVKAYFKKDEDDNYSLREPFELPTDKGIEIIEIKLNFNGWKLYARTPLLPSYYYSSIDENIVLNLTSGYLRPSYVNIDSITTTKLFFTFKVEDLGFDSVRAYGVRILTPENVLVKENFTNGGTGLFHVVIDSLEQGTLYYCELYGQVKTGNRLLDSKYFTTDFDPIPLTAITKDVSNIKYTSAALNGEILFYGDILVPERGFIWGSNASIDINQNLGSKISGSGLGTYSENIYGLTGGTLYYVKSYAKNTEGEYVYGDAVSFNTISPVLPSVGGVSISNVTAWAITLSGAVVNTGGAPVTQKGFVCGVSNDPTLDSFFKMTNNGTGLGSFFSTMSGLWPNTTYYVRVYAVNSVGVAYGDVMSFRTLPEE